MNKHIDIVHFAEDLFAKPKIFFRKYFDQHEKPPFFIITLVIFGIAYAVQRLDLNLKPNGFTDNWIAYWIIALAGGLVGGYLGYLIGGWFYNVRLKWAGGTSDIDLARNLFLYSEVVSGVPVILSTIISFILKNRPSDTVSVYYSIVTIVILMVFDFYSIFVSFCGVTTITDVDYNKARLWFSILPALLYILSYMAILSPYFRYFTNS